MEGSVEGAAEWGTVPVGRGHDGLRTLAAEGFSGGVTDGRVWAMLTNGRVVGVVGGDLTDLEDADLTAHEAPDPALPLLAVMRERSAEPRAQYYTEETPLSQVDDTLRGGGFTGYVELAENVLSGDYYLVYYGGERMPVAFVGGSRRLETGDEAFDRAAGEVGIYDVHAVDVSIVEVPGADPDDGAVGAAAATTGDGSEDADASAESGDDADASDDTSGGDDAAGQSGAPSDEPTGAPPEVSVGAADRAADGETESTAAEDEAEDADETDDVERTDADEADDAEPTASEDGADEDAEDETEDADDATPRSTDDGGVDAAAEDATDGRADAPGEDEPDDTAGPPVVGAADADATDGATDDTADESPASGDEPDESTADAEGAVAWTTTEDGVAADDDERLAALREERDDLRERNEALTDERDELRAEVADLRDRLAAVERERDELRAEAAPGDGGSGPSMSAAAALSGTNLFVRYRSKAQPTLDRALDDGAAREAVDENLLLERHTTFETDGATVDGRPYDQFLPTTLQYRFVEWLVRALPFELRDAAGKRPLGRLYKAIPSFDRAEIDGTVAVRTDDGEDERSFDVVLRSRKGAPLAVASLFAGREPATEAMLSELVEDAKAAAAANESLGAAVFVTTSYYAPDALELAEAEASGGGLFGRGSRESYVRLDRSHGFHLCLVEARDDDFHLGVPEL
jgi:hypothetical protein